MRAILELLAKDGHYTIQRGELVDSGTQELKRTTQYLTDVHADQPDIMEMVTKITKTSDHKWEEYRTGFKINLEVDQ